MTAEYFIDMPEEEYHSDPFEEISISSGMLRTLALKTPSHLKAESARLNPLAQHKSAQNMDRGSVIHKILVGGDGVAWLDFKDYRTKAAKEAKEAAYSAGRTPMLLKEKEEIKMICAAVKEQIKNDPENNDALRSGDFESSAFWHEEIDGEKVFCRARFDNVDFEAGSITDIKSTGVLLTKWERTELYGNKYYLQAEHYSRAFKAITGKRPKRFRFLLIETSPPYLIKFIEVHPSYQDLIEEYYNNLLRVWKHSLKINYFAGYPAGTHYVHMPSYELSEVENNNYLMENL